MNNEDKLLKIAEKISNECSQISNSFYKIADKKQGAAIIQEDGKTYTMAMVSEEDADLAKIGDSINNWMTKQK